jgi:hypothetical protein
MDEVFMEKQCYKIAYYVAKTRGLEILQMKCEFFKDDFKDIYFYNAKDIVYRKNKLLDAGTKKNAAEIAKKDAQNKEQMR